MDWRKAIQAITDWKKPIQLIMDWKKIQNAILIVALPIVLTVILFSAHTIYESWATLETPQRSSVAANLIGAMGTLALAIATFSTVLHSSKRLKRQERESEKLSAKNEVEHLIQPAIAGLRNNIKYLEENYEIEWLYYDPSHQSNFDLQGGSLAGYPTPVISTKDPHALVRLEDKSPNIYKDLQEHDEMLHHLAMRADEIAAQIDEPLKQFIDENNLNSAFNSNSDINTLKSSIIREKEQYAERNNHYDIWDEYRADFLNILYTNAGDEFEDFRSLEDTYHTHCESLVHDLEERKKELQKEYGFVAQNESDEPEFGETVAGRVT